MSVRFHENVSFDSTKYRVDWRDDFWGDSIDARWATAGSGGGTVAVVDAQDGGVCRITTGATNTFRDYIDWSDYRSLHVDKKIVFETRTKLNQTATSNYRIFLRFDFDNCIFFDYSSTVAPNWMIESKNGGASTSQDSGVVVDTSYHVYRIETNPTAVRFYIDNILVGTITTNIPSDAADYLQPYFYLRTWEDAAKSADIDYVYIRQER